MEIKHFEYPDDMDKDCIQLCDLFNSIGLKTVFSCSGHDRKKFMIIFDDSVTTNKIDTFISQISIFHNHTPLLGKFLMWSRKIDTQIVHSWVYISDCIEWANEDYKTLLSKIRSWIKF